MLRRRFDAIITLCLRRVYVGINEVRRLPHLVTEILADKHDIPVCLKYRPVNRDMYYLNEDINLFIYEISN